MELLHGLNLLIFFIIILTLSDGVSGAATTIDKCTPCNILPGLSADLTGSWSSYINAQGVLKATWKPNNCTALKIICKGSSVKETVMIGVNNGRILTKSNGSVTYGDVICNSDGKWVNKSDKKKIDTIHCVKNKPTTKTTKKTTVPHTTTTKKPAASNITTPSSNGALLCGPKLTQTIGSMTAGSATFTYDSATCRKTVTIKCSSTDKKNTYYVAIVLNDDIFLQFDENTVSTTAKFINGNWTTGIPAVHVKKLECVMRPSAK